jgi:hypothetical protein
VEGLVETFDTFVSEGTTKVTELQTQLGNIGEQAAQALIALFTEMVTNALGEAFAPVQNAFAVFEQAQEGCKELLGGGIGDVTENIEAITEIIDKIKPIADLIQDMLG